MAIASVTPRAGTVPLGKWRERAPAQAAPLLFVQRQIGVVVGVDEKMTDGLKVVAAPFHEIDVLPWNQGADVGRANVRPAFPAIRSKRFQAPECEPEFHFRSAAFEDGQQHFLVIAEKRDNGAMPLERDDLVQDALTIRAPVDVIAKENRAFTRIRG